MPGARPGERRGGRSKGTPNRDRAAVVKAALEAGLTPRDYLLSIMRDESQDQVIRMKAAESVAPYVHHRLAAIDMTGEVKATMVIRAPEIMADPAAWQRQYAPKR